MISRVQALNIYHLYNYLTGIEYVCTISLEILRVKDRVNRVYNSPGPVEIESLKIVLIYISVRDESQDLNTITLITRSQHRLDQSLMLTEIKDVIVILNDFIPGPESINMVFNTR